MTQSTPIRVLVVDDQSFMRIALRRIIEADGDIRVVGEARNGVEAVALARQLRPDVITMDVEMPEMDGLEACSRILDDLAPPPAIIMVSAFTQSGAQATTRALRLGAVDFVSKSSLRVSTDLAQIDSELRPKLRAWSRRDRRTPSAAAQSVSAEYQRNRDWVPDLVLIAASTGGPQALTALLKALGPVEPPVVIALHMPEFFTASFAEMLSQDTGCEVREGGHRERLLPRLVTLLPGGRDGIVGPAPNGGYELRLVKIESTFHPSADALFESAAMVAMRPVGVVLTGMGEDGAKGAAALHRKGAPLLVQEPSSCIVGGMPEAAIAAVAQATIRPVEGIAELLRCWARRAESRPY
jgi:two-component system, chemotaxis family, protein-glutamate methylesterase/glutaminase